MGRFKPSSLQKNEWIHQQFLEVTCKKRKIWSEFIFILHLQVLFQSSEPTAESSFTSLDLLFWSQNQSSKRWKKEYFAACRPTWRQTVHQTLWTKWIHIKCSALRLTLKMQKCLGPCSSSPRTRKPEPTWIKKKDYLDYK